MRAGIGWLVLALARRRDGGPHTRSPTTHRDQRGSSNRYATSGFPGGMAKLMERLWLDGQDELVRLSSRGHRIVVDGAGHDVHRDRPQVVLDALREMLATVNRAGSP